MSNSKMGFILEHISKGVDKIKESACKKVTEGREKLREVTTGVIEELGERFKDCEFRKTGKVQYSLGGLIFRILLARAAGKLSRNDVEKWLQDSQYQIAELHPELSGQPSATLIYRMQQKMPKDLVEKAFASLNGNYVLEKSKKDGSYGATDISMRLVLSIDGQLILATQMLLKEQPTEESMWKRTSGISLVTMYCGNYGFAVNQRTCTKKNQEAKCAIEMLDEQKPYNAIITADAANCNRALIATIIKYRCDYLIALKGNAGNIYDETVKLFYKECQHMRAHVPTSEDLIQGVAITNEGDSNLFVRKSVFILPSRCLPTERLRKTYANMKSLIRIVTYTENLTTHAETINERYFVSSLSADKNDPNSAWKFANVKIMEWTVETQHKYLDHNWRQDQHAYRLEQSASNSSWFTKTCLNCLLARKNEINETRKDTCPVSLDYVISSCANDAKYGFDVLFGETGFSSFGREKRPDPQIAKWDESLLSVEREERLSGWRQSPKEKLPPGFDLGTKTSQDGTCEDNELSALWQRIRKKAEELPEGMAELLRSHPKRRRRRKEPVAA